MFSGVVARVVFFLTGAQDTHAHTNNKSTHPILVLKKAIYDTCTFVNPVKLFTLLLAFLILIFQALFCFHCHI